MAFLERQAERTNPRVEVGATVESANMAPQPAPQGDPDEFDASLVKLLKSRRERLAAPLSHPPIAHQGH
jgi:hypothetical protein